MKQSRWIVRAHTTVLAESPEAAAERAAWDAEGDWTIDAVEDVVTGRNALRHRAGFIAALAASAAFPSKLAWDTVLGVLT